MKSVRSIYGLSKPYNFERALPLFTAVALLLLMFAVMVGMALSGRLTWGSYRSIYFLYLASLTFTAGVLSVAPRLAWLLIALCFLDFALGTTISALHKMNIVSQSMLPSNSPLTSEPSLFQFHSLLQAVPKPNILLSTGVLRFQHDSYGLRGPERDPEQLKRQIVIATVGGSSTYGAFVANDDTYPDALERILGDGYAVLNHGVPGYSTAEHLIQTLFYLDSYGVKPQCAIYYVGWNDIRNAHVPNLDPGYADFHLLSQLQNLKIRKTPALMNISPLGRIVVRNLDAWLNAVPFPKNLYQLATRDGERSAAGKIFPYKPGFDLRDQQEPGDRHYFCWSDLESGGASRL